MMRSARNSGGVLPTMVNPLVKNYLFKNYLFEASDFKTLTTLGRSE
jgi:hypothetical protein